MRTTRHARHALTGIALIAALGLAGCGGGDDDGGGGTASGGGATRIALLLPETKTTRYEAHDRPDFEAKVKALCGDCTVDYANAAQDATKQQTQAEAALTNGADVLVLDAVDVASVGPIVSRARQRKVPVIAYDRLIADQPIDFYVSFDNVRQGRLQGQSLVDRLGADAGGKPVVMINGAPTDPSAGDYKRGAHQALERAGVEIAKEFDTPDWSPDKAQRQMEQAITALGKGGIAGVYSANDGMAGGAIAAMKSGGVDPERIPVTGGDGEIAALQRILTGEQYSTIYLTIKKQAETAAALAVAAARGEKPPADLVNTTVETEAGSIPSSLLTPVVVTKDTIAGTVIKDGFYRPEEICTRAFADACEQAGIG